MRDVRQGRPAPFLLGPNSRRVTKQAAGWARAVPSPCSMVRNEFTGTWVCIDSGDGDHGHHVDPAHLMRSAMARRGPAPHAPHFLICCAGASPTLV